MAAGMEDSAESKGESSEERGHVERGERDGDVRRDVVGTEWKHAVGIETQVRCGIVSK
ncbi:unnamed protein product [Dovyalis caffra]|uniref:Uncharacterized protein n=1 Tax=Dovyalis caffra TaxID=77055 RepID=A0AAV1SJS3_9ROSI|nr:unnamed protein product [Dovyalis caffra]